MKLPTAGLLSRWGFQDGDILEDFLWENGYAEAWRHDCRSCDGHGFDHRVLIRVVREHVIPQIEQTLDVFDVVTIHNPIRARTVDGQQVRVVSVVWAAMWAAPNPTPSPSDEQPYPVGGATVTPCPHTPPLHTSRSSRPPLLLLAPTRRTQPP